MVAVLLKHERLGSYHLHLDKNDKNNVFLVIFKTNPPNNTGLPHILEHTTLCGSYKYPIRDPFFKMLNRSLSNFMNAMTGHDYTFYPFATTNSKDFNNLIDVYLSSVFEPLLTYEDFTQEGWRLENEDPHDIKSPLTFKGVVYNEMKGQYSNSSYYYYIKFQESIYSSLNNSGGDPKYMTNLQYEDLVDFHNSNYHPSNAKTFTYGTFSLVDHLQKLNEYYSKFGSRSNKNVIKTPDLITKSMEKVIDGPVDVMSSKPIEQQLQGSITWYLGDPLKLDLYEIFKWKILNSLLCDGHTSPFYQELIETEFGDDFTVNSGLDSTTSLFSFTVGITNLTQEKIDVLNEKIQQILKDKVLVDFEKGVFEQRVDAILHQLELGFKKHRPEFGLGLLNSIVSTWVNEQDPIESLEIDRILEKFKADYQQQGLGLFKPLIDILLDSKTPSFKFTMKPDPNFSSSLIVEEQNRSARETANLSQQDKEIIYQRSLKLLEKQGQEDDVSVLPTLGISDIPRQGDFFSCQLSNIDNQTLLKRIVDANGLVYLTAAKTFDYLPPKYYRYMPLFISCLTNLAGTESTSILDLESKIQKSTGGISFSFNNRADPYDINNVKLQFVMSGMALNQNAKEVLDLWYEILTSTKFDDSVIDKLYILIKSMGQNQMDTIAERGHSYAGSFSTSKLTPSKNIRNMTNGLGQVEFVLDLNKTLESKGKEFLKLEVLPILREIQQLAVNGGFNYHIIGDNDCVINTEPLISKFHDKLPVKSYKDQLTEFIHTFQSSESTKTLLDLPFQIGYSSYALKGASFSHKDGAALQVLSHLLSFKHLHSLIRESNGAYGGGLTFDGMGGTLNYYSYRDPNPLKSIRTFKQTYEEALQKVVNWKDSDLQEAKLSIFQSVDAPSSISTQGLNQFLDGITDEMKQERRERFLDVNNVDLTRVIEQYLNGVGVGCVIGDKAKLGDLNGWDIKNYQKL